MINDMLFLARADQGEAATGRIHAVLADEVGKTAEFFEFLLDEAGMRVRIDGDREAKRDPVFRAGRRDRDRHPAARRQAGSGRQQCRAANRAGASAAPVPALLPRGRGAPRRWRGA
ncbi:hypothetical protein G6F24_017417 [Rhizopus arrhizus]|nr:hypothetical protein G6F24_017417 [Rhizopus arrhizus]